MSDHIGSLLDAYLDNELPSSKRCAIEEHLTNCSLCQREIKQRRRLAVLLKEAPPVTPIKSEKQFISAISSQLQGRSTKGWSRGRVLRLGWRAIPVGLLLLIAFIQTVSLIGTVTEIIPGLNGILLGSLSWSPIDRTLSDPMRILFGLLGVFRLPDWNWITGMMASIIISLMYLSWMVVWWVQYHPVNERPMIYKGVN